MQRDKLIAEFIQYQYMIAQWLVFATFMQSFIVTLHRLLSESYGASLQTTANISLPSGWERATCRFWIVPNIEAS